ncbi:hypothetical protein D0T90_03630 [Neisseria animalis]|uniref:Uncharacterized protein n=1 Tax=Neisseria animalis TaxID=492 RepID=A0A5P3MQ48_NEIAN|nr:hypothetical protein D0T90_03630 [Neisseria animalis]
MTLKGRLQIGHFTDGLFTMTANQQTNAYAVCKTACLKYTAWLLWFSRWERVNQIKLKNQRYRPVWL